MKTVHNELCIRQKHFFFFGFYAVLFFLLAQGFPASIPKTLQAAQTCKLAHFNLMRATCS